MNALPLVLVALGIIGACAGSLFATRWRELHGLNALTAGLFFALAILLVFPEALHTSSWPVVLLFAVAGSLLFGLVDTRLHHSIHHSKRWAIVFAIVAFHNIMDGWNIGVGSQLDDPGFAAAFSFGMGVHKLVGGFAIGAMLRRNLAIAALAEAVTILGLLAERLLLPRLGQAWTGWMLAATGGSFLFLAFHIFAEARHEAGLSKTAAYAAAGFLIIAIAAVAERF